MFERYTEQARRAIYFARLEAIHRRADAITPAHMLLGISFDEDSRANSIAALKDNLCGTLSMSLNIPQRPCTSIPYSTKTEIPLSDDAKKTLAYAALEAGWSWHHRLDTDDLLCGLLRFPNEVSEALRPVGVTLQTVRAASKRHRKQHPPDRLSGRELFAAGTRTLRPAFIGLAIILIAGLAVVLLIRLIQ
jgi:ATP-dependent Clp protease ATP-binding subunit ClpC